MTHVAELRKNKGYSSQEHLANHIGVARSVIAKLEAGIAVPRWEALQKIAGALDCTVDELLPAKPDSPAV